METCYKCGAPLYVKWTKKYDSSEMVNGVQVNGISVLRAHKCDDLPLLKQINEKLDRILSSNA